MSSPLVPDNQSDEAFSGFLVDVACEINADYSGVVLNRGGLESAIRAPFQGFGGEPRFKSLYDVAAALLINVATGHHFQDGNKRTALVLAVYYLQRHEIEVIPQSQEKGAKLVEDVVKEKEIPYEKRRESVRSKLQEWTVIDQTARDHRAHMDSLRTSK